MHTFFSKPNFTDSSINFTFINLKKKLKSCFYKDSLFFPMLNSFSYIQINTFDGYDYELLYFPTLAVSQRLLVGFHFSHKRLE